MEESLEQPKEQPIASFIWCGVRVIVYSQTVKFAGTMLHRHFLPTNLRLKINEEVQQAAMNPGAHRHSGYPARNLLRK